MTTEEAMALAEVLQCAAALNKNPAVLSSADTPRHTGIISLGGGVYNSFTATSISDFCPGLTINPCGPGQDTRISHGSTQIDTPSPVQSIAFIIFLSSFITGCRGPVLLIFGEYGIDTCAAAHYLRRNADKLYRQFRGRFRELGFPKDPWALHDVTVQVPRSCGTRELAGEHLRA